MTTPLPRGTHRVLAITALVSVQVACMTQPRFTKQFTKHECDLLETCWEDFDSLYVSQAKCRELRSGGLSMQQSQYDVLCEFQPRRASQCVAWLRSEATCLDVNDQGSLETLECIQVYNCPTGLVTSDTSVTPTDTGT